MEAQLEKAIVENIRYNNWADQKVLEVCRKLDEAELRPKAPGDSRDAGSHRQSRGFLHQPVDRRTPPAAVLLGGWAQPGRTGRIHRSGSGGSYRDG